MTWGSNATGMKMTCRYCDGECYDDTDEGPNTHEMECPERFLMVRLKKALGIWTNIPKAKAKYK